MLPEEKRIHSKEDLNRFLNNEMAKYGKSSSRGVLLWFRERDILAKHNRLLRKTEFHLNSKHRLRGVFYRLRLNRLQNKLSIHIPLNCCDEGLKIMHVGPVLMNKDVTEENVAVAGVPAKIISNNGRLNWNK